MGIPSKTEYLIACRNSYRRIEGTFSIDKSVFQVNVLLKSNPANVFYPNFVFAESVEGAKKSFYVYNKFHCNIYEIESVIQIL